MITAVDSNILIDVLDPDPVFGNASGAALKRCLAEGALAACDVVWAEVAAAYTESGEALVTALDTLGLEFSPLTRDAALQAARYWHQFRKQGGGRSRIAADFLIGAHAREQCDRLLTRDRGFYRRYFSELTIIDPCVH